MSDSLRNCILRCVNIVISALIPGVCNLFDAALRSTRPAHWTDEELRKNARAKPEKQNKKKGTADESKGDPQLDSSVWW